MDLHLHINCHNIVKHQAKKIIQKIYNHKQKMTQ